MEEPEDNMVQVRKSHKVEQMVSKWLRLTRDNSQRNRATADGASANTNQQSTPLKVTVKINKDPLLDHGFIVSEETPVCVKSVTAGGPGEGKLFPGDQIIKINNMPLDTISREHIDNIIRECGNSITVTVLRTTLGPKSSFITEEKRARLKSNPVKVRFAEEVIVNGHTQGNSLLFMPNVLKVYLENGQTKAFRYEKNTTVKDIILTLKSKLSIRCIEHFALGLKERYSVSKVYLLHDDEIIEQVVQKREPHDYRCLFRVCFLPRDPLVLLRDDPVAFEYLYFQSCNDVLQEKYAMEMKCNTAIRLAALQIQECILSSKQSQKVSLKYIEKDWGIENFVSPTLLHNMKEKDIRKAINYHLKNNHSLIAPGQKQLISTAQARLNYLNILGDLRTYGGKTFNATLMDRESFITLLVGAKYGISQVINSKLNIMTQLTNFNNIRKLELTFECDKVSMVNIYLVDVKSLTLLLESHHAKDLVCLIAGYHRLYVNSTEPIFAWPGNYQSQPLTNEEGDESRGLSDSESSSDIDSSLDMSIELHKLRNGFIQPLTEEVEDIGNSESEATDSDYIREEVLEETTCSTGDVSDLKDEATSQGGVTCERSCSADSMEELQSETSTSSTSCLQSHGEISEEDDKDSVTGESESEPVTKKPCMVESNVSLPQPSADSLTFTRILSEYCRSDAKEPVACSSPDFSQNENSYAAESRGQCSEDVGGSRAQRNGSWSLTGHEIHLLTEIPPIPLPEEATADGDLSSEVLTIPILDPPPGFRDSSSEDEFFDAADKFIAIESPVDVKLNGTGTAELESAYTKGIEEKWNMRTSSSLYGTGMDIKSAENIKSEIEAAKYATNTEQGHFALKDLYDVKTVLSQCYSSKGEDHMCCYERENLVSGMQQSPTLSSLTSTESEPALLETKSIGPLKSISICANKKATSDLMEMEPDTMETKSVTEAITVITPVSATRYPCDADTKEGYAPKAGCSEGGENTNKPVLNVKLPGTDCSNMEECSSPSGVTLEPGHTCSENPTEDKTYNVTTVCCTDEQQILNTISMKAEERDEAIVENSTVLEKEHEKCAQWVDIGQNGTARRQTLCQIDAKEHTFKEETENCDRGGSCYQDDNGSITSQIYSVMPSGDQAAFPEKSILEEEISSRRESSEVDKESKDAYSLDMSRLLLNLNRVSFKTFGMVKHLSSPTLEPKMEVFSVRSPNISEFHMESAEGSSRDCLSKTEQNTNQVESLMPLTQKHINEFGATILCPQDKNPPQEASSPTNTSKLLYEVNNSVTQESATPTRQNECLQAKSNSLKQPEDTLDLNVSSRISAVLTSDMGKQTNKQLSMGGKQTCGCQMAYGNCFRALGTDVNDEIKDLENSAQRTSPRTTPPASGSPLSLYLTRFTRQSDETMLTSCYFGVPKTDATAMHDGPVLSKFKDKRYNMPNGFRLVQNDIVELLDVLKDCPRESHVEEECAILFSSTKQKLYTECRKLISTCQKGIKVDRAPDEMLLGVSESFQALTQLTATCLQFTTCMHCADRHVEVLSNLREVVMTYKTFVQASEDACSRSSDDLSVKLLAQQYTALTAGVFSLTQLFKSDSPSQ